MNQIVQSMHWIIEYSADIFAVLIHGLVSDVFVCVRTGCVGRVGDGGKVISF